MGPLPHSSPTVHLCTPPSRTLLPTTPMAHHTAASPLLPPHPFPCRASSLALSRWLLQLLRLILNLRWATAATGLTTGHGGGSPTARFSGDGARDDKVAQINAHPPQFPGFSTFPSPLSHFPSLQARQGAMASFLWRQDDAMTTIALCKLNKAQTSAPLSLVARFPYLVPHVNHNPYKGRR